MTESNAILRLENVGFQADDVTILNEISFQLRAGEFKLITGPSGCGKSTLLKIIASLLSPTAGSIFFAGKNCSFFQKFRKGSSDFRRTGAGLWRCGGCHGL